MRQGWLGDDKQENSQNPRVGSKRLGAGNANKKNEDCKLSKNLARSKFYSVVISNCLIFSLSVCSYAFAIFDDHNDYLFTVLNRKNVMGKCYYKKFISHQKFLSRTSDEQR